jgi:hypothetical protein
LILGFWGVDGGGTSFRLYKGGGASHYDLSSALSVAEPRTVQDGRLMGVVKTELVIDVRVLGCRRWRNIFPSI